MTVRLLDPTSAAPEDVRRPAPRPEPRPGLRIAVLANGKANGDVLARETALLLAKEFGWSIVAEANKGNATRVCDPALLRKLAEDSDLLVTAVGD